MNPATATIAQALDNVLVAIADGYEEDQIDALTCVAFDAAIDAGRDDVADAIALAEDDEDFAESLRLIHASL